MYEFQFYMPTKVLFGAGQLNKLHTEKMPGKKALIVTSNGTSTKMLWTAQKKFSADLFQEILKI